MPILKILVFSVILFFVGLISLYPDKLGLCGSADRGCIYPIAFNVGEPLTFYMLLFIPSVILVFLFRNIVYQAWKKFALVYVPLSAIFIALAPVSCGGNFISFFCFTKENTSWLTALGFLLLTLILIITKNSKQNLTKVYKIK